MKHVKGPVLLTYRGKTKNIREWAKHSGLSEGCIQKRLGRGWSVERMFA